MEPKEVDEVSKFVHIFNMYAKFGIRNPNHQDCMLNSLNQNDEDKSFVVEIIYHSISKSHGSQ